MAEKICFSDCGNEVAKKRERKRNNLVATSIPRLNCAGEKQCNIPVNKSQQVSIRLPGSKSIGHLNL